jgi:Fe2+ transport system protein B
VGIFDATNTTRSRREEVLKELQKVGIEKKHVIFLESICNDKNIIRKNILNVKINGDDYKETSTDDAIQDFEKRIENYEKIYETICDEYDNDKCYMKIIDLGDKIILNKIKGIIVFP